MMIINDKPYRAVWMEGNTVYMIDQQRLPFDFAIVKTVNYKETCIAIREMVVRGAGTIGATAGFAMAQAFLEVFDVSHRNVNVTHFDFKGIQDRILQAKSCIESTRPTARDLFYAVDFVYSKGIQALEKEGLQHACEVLREASAFIADQYVFNAKKIGEHGLSLIREGYNILTHCNAGWLALVDWGSALSPIFHAHQSGVHCHVWVDETRPRLQGSRLTAWELQQAGIPHTIIPDNAAAYLMTLGKVDMVITGADRIAANGDVANKIGTFEKAILAREFGIPFYVAAPASTFDWQCNDGGHIIIEERDQHEVTEACGPDGQEKTTTIRIANPGSPAFNPAFDVTPARFVTAYITESGIYHDITLVPR